MSLAEWHFDSLEQHVRVHEERLVRLRDQLEKSSDGSDPNPKGDPNPKPPLPNDNVDLRDLLHREVRFHEELIEFARNPKVLDVLGQLADDPDFTRWATRDPISVAEKFGIKVPAALVMRVYSDPNGARLRICSYDGLYPFMVTWDSRNGFSPVRESVSKTRGA